jgi:hypothetical protein
MINASTHTRKIWRSHFDGADSTMPAKNMNVIFWVVNFKTQNYFVISTTQKVYLRLSMYDCSNFVHSYRIFGISELQTV